MWIFYYIDKDRLIPCNSKQNNLLNTQILGHNERVLRLSIFDFFKPSKVPKEAILIGFSIENDEIICSIGNLNFAYNLKLKELKLLFPLIEDENKLKNELIARCI